MSRLRSIGIALAVACAFAGAAHAQSTTGSITGVVRLDTTHKPLPGVSVVATGPALAQEQTEFTDSNGQYTITDLPPGEYTITFYFSTAKLERKGILLTADKTLTVSGEIGTGKIATQIFHERAPSVDSTHNATETTISEEVTKMIPSVQGGFSTYESVLRLTPGAGGDAEGTTFGGSTGLESNYLIEGFNTTDPAFGRVGSSLSLQFIRETEVILAGYGAEYGRSTGGVVNVVTKSGSNEFHGGIHLYYTPFERQPTRVLSATGAINVQQYFNYGIDFGVDVGGPIIKDKIWFYVGFNPQTVVNSYDRLIRTKTYNNIPATMQGGSYAGDVQNDNSCPPWLTDKSLCTTQQSFIFTDLPQYTKTYNTTNTQYFLDGKIDFQLNENNRAAIEYFGNPQSFSGAIGSFAAPEKDLMGSFNAASHDIVASFSSKLLDRKLLIEARLGYHLQISPLTNFDDPTVGGQSAVVDLRNSNLNLYEGGPGSMTPYPECNRTTVGGTGADKNVRISPCTQIGMQDGGWGGNTSTTLSRLAATAGATYFARLAGTHAIKLGGDFEDNYYDDFRQYTGGALFSLNPGGSVSRFMYATFDAAGNAIAKDKGFEAKTNTLNESLYLRDAWNVGFVPGLTLNLGIRWELQQVKDINGNTAISITDNIAPRLGFVYDFTHKGLGKIYASYGRYFESIPLDINDREFSGEGSSTQVIATGGCVFQTDNKLRLNVQHWNDTCPSLPGPQRADILGGTFGVVAPNLKGMYTNEYSAGIQYDVGLDLVLGAAYLHRDLGRIVEDISPDGGLNYFVTNPGEPNDAGTISDLQNQVKALDQQIMGATGAMRDNLVTQRNLKAQTLQFYENVPTWDKPVRDYNALIITANKRLSHNFILLASYTYSRTTGNYPGLFSASNGQTDPNISSAYDLKEFLVNRYGPMNADHPHALKLDGAYMLNLGGNKGALQLGASFHVVSGTPIDVLGVHPTYGINETFLLQRGAGGRTPTISQLNLRLSYQRRLSKTFNMNAYWDIYNVFDQRQVEAVDNSYTFDTVLPIANGTFADLKNLKNINGTAVTPNPNYGRATAYQTPISMKLSVEVTF